MARVKLPALKVVFLGDTGTGKTSLITRFVDSTFTGELESTVGGWGRPVRFTYRDKPVDLIVWDTAGQEKYRGLTPMYYRNAVAAVVVFDVTNRHSFDQVQGWINELQTTAGQIIIVICANKIDLSAERTIGESEAEAFADTAGTPYCEASAKSGYGIANLFHTVVQRIAEERPGLIGQPQQSSGAVDINGGERRRGSDGEGCGGGC
jgi:small GTP-binding protein